MNASGSTTTTPLFSNKLYDRLKYLALVLLPAFSAMYFGLGEIWGFPKVTEVIGTVAVLDTALGVVLRQSNVNYRNSDDRFDGSINKELDEGDTVYSVSVDGNPHEVIDANDELTLKVNKETEAVEVEVVEQAKPRKRASRKKS